MQQAVIKLFPRAIVKYEFINRAGTEFPENFASELRKQVQAFETLALSDTEARELKNKCGSYLDPTYITYLKGYRFDPSQVGIVQDGKELKVQITGPWHETILWEVPLMATISELYYELIGNDAFTLQVREELNIRKAQLFNHGISKIADFGSRRRFSYENHNLLVRTFVNNNMNNWFVGTSNVHFAIKYNIKAIGTHAHEWFSFHAAKYGYRMANKIALDNWVRVYRGDLGIALPDTFTTDSFLESFDTMLAKLFDGVRHDSNDPIDFTDKIVNHYNSLNIDPTTKTIVFSDNLNTVKVGDIEKYCIGKIRASFGIGTHFTNDVGVKPLNMVIKMVAAKPAGKDFINTIKLSDDKMKYTGDPYQIDLCKKSLNINEKIKVYEKV